MGDPEHALAMLEMARKDLTALGGMLDRAIFADEVFGFHAQQAVEKALKAWLALSGSGYPKIHDLQELMALLRDNSQEVPKAFQELIDLTDFAAQFRYEAFDDLENEFDRKELVARVTAVFTHVEGLIARN